MSQFLKVIPLPRSMICLPIDDLGIGCTSVPTFRNCPEVQVHSYEVIIIDNEVELSNTVLTYAGIPKCLKPVQSCMYESMHITMPSSLIKVGFVGLSARGGWASMTHGPALTSLSEKYMLTAISTSSPESASNTADKFTKSTGHPIKAYHGNSDGISNDANVELVAVSVKAPNHKEAALPAIDARKDVFLEWPAGASLAESTELAEAARKQGIRSIVGLQCRQSRSLKKVLVQLDGCRQYLISNQYLGTGVAWRNRSSAIYDDCE